jgi:hypothetical protein
MSAPYPNGRVFPAAGESPPARSTLTLANGAPLELEHIWTNPMHWDWCRQGQAAADAKVYAEWLQFHDEAVQ